MRSITGNVRRATEDLDLDFIKYSLEDESIRYFISKLNCLEGIKIEIKGNKIEQLSQQEYSGKRVYIIIKDDEGNIIESKIDLGVMHITVPESDAVDRRSMFTMVCGTLFSLKNRISTDRSSLGRLWLVREIAQ